VPKDASSDSPRAGGLPNSSAVVSATNINNQGYASAPWQTLAAEATKYTVLVIAVLYAMGFIIWHSFLGTYGVSSIGFLQAEYLSAAICYILLVACFTMPLAVLLDHLLKPRDPSKPGSTLSYLISVWYLITIQLLSMFFPGSPESRLAKTYMVAAFALLVSYLIGLVALRKRCGSSPWYKFISELDLFTLIMMGYLVIRTVQNSSISLMFILLSVCLYLVFFYHTGQDLRKTWPAAGLKVRSLLACLMCLLIISNLNVFGNSQFGKIHRGVGGGKPEQAYLKFSAQHQDLPFALRIPATQCFSPSNTFYGPVEILLRSDKELIFLNPAEAVLPDYLTNNVSTNALVILSTNFVTNVVAVMLTNGTGAVAKNDVTNWSTTIQTNRLDIITNTVMKNPIKITAKQVRADIVDAVMFAK